jgi:hypothetical protein
VLPRSSTRTSGGDRGRPWPARDEPDGRRPAVAVVGLALLLVAGTTVALLDADGSPGSFGALPAKTVPADAASTTDAPPAAAAPGSADAAVIEPLLVAPEGLRWLLFMGVALPYSRTAGPTVVDGPVYGGFECSQPGALLAAVHLGVRYLLTPGEGWREVLERQVLPGAGREAFARNRAGIDPQAPPGTYGQIAGFRIVTFTQDVAVVQLVSRFPTSGVLQVSTTTVRWVDDDWRLQLQPDGGTSPTAQAVPNLDGFVVWGA